MCGGGGGHIEGMELVVDDMRKQTTLSTTIISRLHSAAMF